MVPISWVILVSGRFMHFVASFKSSKETSTASKIPSTLQQDPGLTARSKSKLENRRLQAAAGRCSLLLVAILLLSSFNLMKIQLAAIMRSNRLTCVIIQIMWPNRIIIASKVNNMQFMECKFGETEPRSVPHSVSCQSAHIRKLVSLHSSVTLLFFSFTLLQFPLYS